MEIKFEGVEVYDIMWKNLLIKKKKNGVGEKMSLEEEKEKKEKI